MPERVSILPFPTHDIPEWDSPQPEEGADDPVTPGTAYLPSPPQRFHVRSLQHWIDLCA